jgi:hypothetical protein
MATFFVAAAASARIRNRPFPDKKTAAGLHRGTHREVILHLQQVGP